MFDKILIANRGEIAVRIIKTARKLGIRTVAVYSQADAQAMHVQLADEAVYIGPAPAAQSYLRADVILKAAQDTGAQAVHPGYGFLSENAKFAEACAAAGIVFIGPPVGAIEAMGSKAESKRLMSHAGVPLVPGYHGVDQDLATLQAQAEQIGYPVLVKASAGGGGKGMRIVERAADLADAVAGAKRESKAAFGDDSLLLEKYLRRPRHVEIQVFADTHGNCVYLFERDCSIQRRHQKVIEEAPAPGLDAALRVRMGEAAVAAARAVNYVGAGTVEFLYEDGEFYFIEMNTRLQVEHPVTEMITGQDLVDWQLQVASGAVLPLTQEQLQCRGHAFEARVYAEDPQRNFLPAIGKLVHLQPPAENAHVRVDTGVRAGDEVSMHYDPMIAKLIVWGESRDAALRRLRRALADYEVAGVATNIGLLSSIAASPSFAALDLDTGFIERHRDELALDHQPAPGAVLALAALAILNQGRASVSVSDPHSPWNVLDGWLMNAPNQLSVRIDEDGEQRELQLHFTAGGYEVELPGGQRIRAEAVKQEGSTLIAALDGVRTRATAVFQSGLLTVIRDGQSWRFGLEDVMAQAGKQGAGAGRLTSPMPGTIVSVLVKAGDRVAADHPLIVMEAMKMEHTIKASAAGEVTEVHFAVGDQVPEGAQLLTLETDKE